jgi:hypothetical protein
LPRLPQQRQIVAPTDHSLALSRLGLAERTGQKINL